MCHGRFLYLFQIQLCNVKFVVKDFKKFVSPVLLGHEHIVYNIVQKALLSVESWKYVYNTKFLKKLLQGKRNKQRSVMSH